MAHARLETHYFVHDCFLEKDQLLKDAVKIQDIPTSIVQGRLDSVCPPISAWALHKCSAEFEVVLHQRRGAFHDRAGDIEEADRGL